MLYRHIMSFRNRAYCIFTSTQYQKWTEKNYGDNL